MTQPELRNEQVLFNCSNDIEKYECSTCFDFQTNLLAALKSHIRDDHRNKGVEEDVYRTLLHNEQEDTNEEPDTLLHKEQGDTNLFTSGQSSTNLKAKSILKNTRKSSHSGSNHCWSYCKQCSYKTKITRDLKRHILCRHTNPEDIQWLHCAYCPSKFKQKGNLKMHILTHSKPEEPEDVQWVKCDQCPSQFKLRKYLRKHVSGCHSTSDRRFTCDQCPYRSTRSGDLKRHIKSCHSTREGDQWFECEQCASRFNQKQLLTRHLRSHHCKTEDNNSF